MDRGVEGFLVCRYALKVLYKLRYDGLVSIEGVYALTYS